MKNLIAVVLAVLMVSMVGCATFQNDEGPIVQTAPCEVATVEEVAPVMAAAPVEITKVKILEPVMFDWDKADIRADQEEVLAKIADLMDEYKDTALILDGYASTEGADDYNLALSQDRADAVKSALIMLGVEEDRIVNAVGQGEASVFGDLLKLNRRVMVLSVD